MPDAAKGGRPSIGTPITITVPAEVVAVIDNRAARNGVTRAAEARDLLGVAASLMPPPYDVPPSERETLTEDMRRAATLIARWISYAPEKVITRYRNYRARYNDSYRLPRLFEVAWGELILVDDHRDSSKGPWPYKVSEALEAKLADDQQWQVRSQLFFLVMEELERTKVLHIIDTYYRVAVAITEGARLQLAKKAGEEDVEMWVGSNGKVQVRMSEMYRGPRGYGIVDSVIDEIHKAGLEVISPQPEMDARLVLSMGADVEVYARS